jgi:hypothetical protein
MMNMANFKNVLTATAGQARSGWWRLLLLLLLNCPVAAFAAAYLWNGKVSSAWSASGNRNLILPPYSITTAIINNGLASNPANLTATLTNGALNLSWPAMHLGWILQTQTNSLAIGVGASWFDVANSEVQTQAVFPLNQTNPTGFFRLRHP